MAKTYCIIAALLGAMLPASAQRMIIVGDQDDRRESVHPVDGSDRISVAILLADRDGRRFREIQDEQSFFEGERFRLRITPRISGFLYVVCQSSQGETKLLYPHPEASGPAAQLRNGSAVTVPQRAWFQFDDQPGLEQVYLLIAKRPIRELDQAYEEGGDVNPAAIRRLMRASNAATRGADEYGSTVQKGIFTAGAHDLFVRKLELIHE